MERSKGPGIVLLLGMVVVLLMSCTTTKYVEVERVRTDTLIQAKVLKDSVWCRDSVYVKEVGDTVWVEKWHTLERATERHDTVYQSLRDTVQVPYPIEKEVAVEKSLTWWQRFRLFAGDLVLGIGAILLFFWAVQRIILKVVRP